MEQAQAQFPVAQSLRTTLVGQVFAIMMAEVSLMQPIVSPEAFTIDEALDIPLCENINRHSKD
jgi:hypothetical protein